MNRCTGCSVGQKTMTPEVDAAQGGATGLDAARLESYLRSRVAGLQGAMRVEAVAGGQSNPTFFVTFDNARLVLRKRPTGAVLPSAHAVDREYRVQSALAGTPVPVAAMVLFEADESVIGTQFYVMQRVDGVVHADGRLSALAPEQRRPLWLEAAHTLAAIHATDLDATGLHSFGRPGHGLERQLARWSKQWELSRVVPDPDMEWLIGWLRERLPPATASTLVHGDFRLGNCIAAPDRPAIAAVLDWELSTLGDPLSDLAHSCVYGWFVRPDEYGGLMGVDLAAEELPTMAEFVDAYERARRSDQRLSVYHLVFALFRNAAIFEGIAARARDGSAAAANAAEVGRLASTFTQRAIGLGRDAGAAERLGLAA